MEEVKSRGIKQEIKKFFWVVMLRLFNRAVKNIKDPELQSDLQLMIGKPITDFQKVLTDNNPNDLDQIKEVWQKHKQETFYNSIEALESGVRLVVKDEAIQETIIDLLDAYQEEIKPEEDIMTVNFS
jgi:hypothetical protein